jgi:hypothetical protein
VCGSSDRKTQIRGLIFSNSQIVLEMQDHGSAIRSSSSAADRPRVVVMLQLGRANSVLIT